VHWSAGLLGYFPTYSLGAMYACQIFQCAQKEVPGLEEQIRAGEACWWFEARTIRRAGRETAAGLVRIVTPALDACTPALAPAGNFKPLKEWLNVKIHKLGSLHANGDELMTAVTGAPLQVRGPRRSERACVLGERLPIKGRRGEGGTTPWWELQQRQVSRRRCP
jgi:carboxypeptidase Taq